MDASRAANRPRALRKLVTLLKPGGLLVLTPRHGPTEPERGMHQVSLAELEELARDHGLALVRTGDASDVQGRPGVTWTRVAFHLPDDGTGALPLLRHVILNDAKSSTYKLGLLRALCRIADSAAGLARDEDETHVAVPLGLVALTWLRLYPPLAAPTCRSRRRPYRRGEIGLRRARFRARWARTCRPSTSGWVNDSPVRGREPFMWHSVRLSARSPPCRCDT